MFETAAVAFFVGIAIWVILSIISKGIGRLFPRYAVWRAVQKQAMINRAHEKDKQSKARKKARMAAWAEAHPDSPMARSYNGMLASKKAETVVEDFDPAQELANRQAEEDDRKRRQDKHRADEERKDQEIYAWALDNPGMTAARRYLDDRIVELQEVVTQTDRYVSWHNPDRYEEGTPEASEAATSHNDSVAKRDAALKEIAEIGKVLEETPVSDMER